MRVGLVRNVGLGMVALFTLGIAGCDDNPIDFNVSEATQITTNPSKMTVTAGDTARLDSRTVNQGGQPTWEEITPSVDSSCEIATDPAGTVAVDVAVDYEPLVQPPGQFDVVGGTTLGKTCITLSGGGVEATVEVTVVAGGLQITGAPDTLNINASVQLGTSLIASDGSPVSPFDPLADVVWSSDNTDALTVDETGTVEAVGIGAAIITATWTQNGVTRTSDVTITVNAPTLEIVDSADGMAPADSLLIFTTVDLDANLINPTDPPADFGPFDQTNVTWSSSDPDVVSVDAETGEATANAPGTATITATWTGNETVQAEVDISTDVPAPTLTSVDDATPGQYDLVTITGTGFIPGAHIVLIDGEELPSFYEPTVVDATTATFRVPGGGGGTELSVTVGLPTIQSNALTVTRTCDGADFDCATEPANDDPSTASVVTFPFSTPGIVEATDVDDLYNFTLAAGATLQIDLTWTGDSGDLDLLVDVAGLPFAFPCAEGGGFPTATGNVPESGQCTLPAGDYVLWVNSFDEEAAAYQLDVSVVP